MIFNQSDKQGGLSFNKNDCEYYYKILENAGLYDLGYTGNDFTWDNHREGIHNIQERLDRAVLNAERHSQFPNASLTHLPAVGSDHCLILLILDPKFSKQEWVFKFYDTSLKDSSCLKVIEQSWNHNSDEEVAATLVNNLRITGNNLLDWKKNSFGLPTKKINKLLKEIEGLQRNRPTKSNQKKLKNKLGELENLYDTQEVIAKQQSRNSIIALGERNTKYFYNITLRRRKRNNIHSMINDQGVATRDRREISSILTSYFVSLFSEPVVIFLTPSQSPNPIFDNISPIISAQDNLSILHIPSPEEILSI